jgi:hypothetical protein
MAVLSRRPGVFTRLISILLAIAVLDGVAVVYSHVHQYDNPLPLPPFALSLPAHVNPGVDDYDAAPASFGFTTTPGRPVLPDRGHVRIVENNRRLLDPDASLRYALAALADHSARKESASLSRAMTAVKEVAATATGGLVPHAIERKDRDGAMLPPGWVSAETQGLFLSALSRLYTATGDGVWRTQADRVFDTLLRFKGGRDDDDQPFSPWLSFVDSSGYLWFEELPEGSTPSQTMTSHLFAVIGIYDYSQIAAPSRREASVDLLAAGAASVQHFIPLLREPGYQAYTSHLRVASSWERTHVLSAQLDAMGKITDQADFTALSETFAGDVYVPPFATTGLRPKPGVVPYVGRSLAALPPTGVTDVADVISPERSVRGGDAPDAVLAEAISGLDTSSGAITRAALRRSISAVEAVLATSKQGLVPHEQPSRDLAGRTLRAPWYSAQTQGLLLSALTRLHSLTGDQVWADEAGAVFATLQRSRTYPPANPRKAPDVWTGYVGDRRAPNRLWFEKFIPNSTETSPDDRPSLVVEAHLAAVIGVYDYWSMTKSVEAVRLFDGAASAVVKRLPNIRRSGDVSRAELVRGTGSLEHHRVLIRQLALLGEMTGDQRFARSTKLLSADAS